MVPLMGSEKADPRLGEGRREAVMAAIKLVNHVNPSDDIWPLVAPQQRRW